MKKKLDGNYTRMLRAVLNKSWRQHPTKQQLHGYQPPLTKTIQIWRTRHVEYCWRSKGELISDVLLWTPSHGRASVVRPARTYLQQLCADTGCSLDQPGAMDDSDRWWERAREICARSTTWWWLLFHSLRVFHISFNKWFFTEVKETTNLHRFSILFWVYHSQIRICETYIECSLHIYIEHRNPETRKTLTTS